MKISPSHLVPRKQVCGRRREQRVISCCGALVVDGDLTLVAKNWLRTAGCCELANIVVQPLHLGVCVLRCPYRVPSR